MLREWVEKTVMGLGLELVELERSAHGLLRVTIDHPWQPGQAEQPVTLDDCERVTRQLQYALEVDGVAYERFTRHGPAALLPLGEGRVYDAAADDDGKRGPEKRRQVLAYVRQRMEELRPWTA